ncbi:MAG: ATP-binding protein [Candidatus Thermoplasmatota archaeon]|nr:ATP-binding protein [Candidatus Thermoplasmatota archaeon]
MFVNRNKEFHILEIATKGILQNEKIDIAIIGNRRIGKTELILEYKNKHDKNNNIIYPYLNIQRLGTIDSFIFSYIRELLFEIGKKTGKISNKTQLSDWDDILILASKLTIEESIKKLKAITNENAVNYLFEIQIQILKQTGFYCIFLLDEFQYVKQFGDTFLHKMRAGVEKEKRVSYIVTGSSVSLMEHIFSESKEPFFAQFRRIYLGTISIPHMRKLARNFLQKHHIQCDDVYLKEIFRLTQGHPFYTISLCRRIIEEFEDIDKDKIQYAFLEETLSPRGDIYLVLDYIFNESLSRAYKGGKHRQILLILAQKQGLTLTEISKKLSSPTGEVSNYMKVLLKTDLLFRENNQYYFRDALLAFWLKNTFLGINQTEVEKKQVRKILMDELQEKYQQVSSELGKAKEYELKEKLGEKFGITLQNYTSDNGQIEFDLMGEKDDTCFIFEIKWRNQPTDYSDIKRLIKKVDESIFSSKKIALYIVSKNDYTKNAKKLAKKYNIALLKDEDV